jgi:hypothetical protein
MTDVSTFVLLNVADTCSLWNLIASRLLYTTSRAAGVRLCCTNFVIYECLHKRSQHRPERIELQQRLKSKLAEGVITAHPIDLEDLQTVEVLRNRKKVSIGELSVLVFASKTQQAILTDDGGAQKLARTHMQSHAIQSTPHLFAWLYFRSFLGDSDIDQVKSDLASLSRSLSPHLETFYHEAQRCRAVSIQAANLQDK